MSGCGPRLTPADLALFANLGIPPELLDAATIQRVTGTQAHDLAGVRHRSSRLEGVWFPNVDPERGSIRGGRVRRDHPEVDSEGKPLGKYLGPPGRHYLYFAPGSGPLLAQTGTAVVFVESEKAALALIAAAFRAGRRLLVIATGGCWGWHGKIGKTTSADGTPVDQKGPLTDFERVAWTDRDVVILFDTNAPTNENVQMARRKLAAELNRRGAKVRIADLPVEDGINGPDDYVGKHGAAAVVAIIDAAKPAESNRAKAKKEKAEKPKQGRDVQFDEPEPWPAAVDGVALLDAIAATFRRYVALPEHASTALTLWILHAYAFEAWFVSPFLALTSPVKRCGKTLTLILLSALVPRRLIASNVTPAVLFRTIEKYSPTLLIDEGDTFVRDNEELRGVLNSGHTRTTASVIRTVGEDHEPRQFSTWCPKAIALIGKLPGTLDDRAIEVAMRRRTAGEHVERLRQDRIQAECLLLRRQAARWTADHLQVLQDADPDVPSALNDRASDCWRPLLALADRAGGNWPALAREAALALSGETVEDDATTLLLRDVRDTFTAAGDPEVMASSVLVERLIANEDRPWREWSHGRPLSPAKLARLLAGYGIHSAGNVRIGEKVLKGYRRAAFEDAWTRYLATEALHGNNSNASGHETAKTNRYTDSACSGLRSATTPMNSGRSYAVAVPEGGEGEDASLSLEAIDL